MMEAEDIATGSTIWTEPRRSLGGAGMNGMADRNAGASMTDAEDRDGTCEPCEAIEKAEDGFSSMAIITLETRSSIDVSGDSRLSCVEVGGMNEGRVNLRQHTRAGR